MRKLSDSIYCILGNKGSHIYYIKKEKGVIFDTGHPIDKEANLKILKDNGLDSSSVSYIVNSHSHFDHVGATQYFKEQYFKNSDIVFSARTPEFIRKKKAVNLYPELEVDFDKFDFDIIVEDCITLDLGNDEVKIYYTPGHSKDSISLYLESENSVFSGDLLYKGVISQVEYNYDIDESLRELEKSYSLIEELNPSIIYPGHGGFFKPEDKDWILFRKKLKRFFKDKELLVINNIIPVFELYFHNNPGIKENDIRRIFFDFLSRPVKCGIITGYEVNDIERIIERSLFLMSTINMIKSDSGRIYLNNELNAHL